MCSTETTLLVTIFEQLDIHPLVGIKLFVYKPRIDDKRLDLFDVPFFGDGIRINRSGRSFLTWYVDNSTAKKIVTIFQRITPVIKTFVFEKSKELVNLEIVSKSDTTTQTKRTLLGNYLRCMIPFKTYISDYCNLNDTLRVSFANLRNPKTDAVYADHTHVCIAKDQIPFFCKLPIGTKLSFMATVHRYSDEHGNEKYGIHDLQDIVVN